MAKITLYTEPGYQGVSKEYTDSVEHLNELNDHISSVVVESGRWILYANSNFGPVGAQAGFAIVEPGRYVDPHALGFPDDHLSSIRLLPNSGICLFEGAAYGGRMQHIEVGSKAGMLDFTAQSVIVISGVWDLHSENDYGGKNWEIPAGQHAVLYGTSVSKGIKSVQPAGAGTLEVVSNQSASANGSGSNAGPVDIPLVELIVDCSGSMKDSKIGSETYMEVAIRVLKDVVNHDIPENIEVALRQFKDSSTSLLVPFGKLQSNKADLLKKIDGFKGSGGTPLADSIKAAKGDFDSKVTEDAQSNIAHKNKLVILVTDGKETVRKKPDGSYDEDAAMGEITELYNNGIGTRVNIIGFAIDSQELKDKFSAWATAGGGEYQDAGNADQFRQSVKKALNFPYDVFDANNMGVPVESGHVNVDKIDLPAGSYFVMVKSNPPQMVPAAVSEGNPTRITV